MSETRLIDKKELGEKHPYLANRWRLNYLVRTGQIPVVRVGKRIAFNEAEIDRWIEENTRAEVFE
jgi:Helix-turn-helix domain